MVSFLLNIFIKFTVKLQILLGIRESYPLMQLLIGFQQPS